MSYKATLYLDESGKSSLAEKEDEPFIIAGVILDDSEVSAVEGYFNYIKRKYEIPLDKPFHSYHIFEYSQTKLDNKQLISLSKDLAEYISLVPITINITAISKSEFKSALGITDLVSYVSFFRARRILSKYDEIGVKKIWETIREKAEFRKFSKSDVRKFFDIKKDGVHKNLK